MLDLKSIICAGYSCMLHLQAMAEEVTTLPTSLPPLQPPHHHLPLITTTSPNHHHLVTLPPHLLQMSLLPAAITPPAQVTIKALICLVDKKTGEKSKTRPRFIKQDQVAIAR